MKNNIIYMVFLFAILGGVSCSIATPSNINPKMENDDVVVYHMPSTGVLDVTIQTVLLKNDVLEKKKINEVVFGVCRDFKWFQPYTIMGIYKVETKMSIGPSYVYYPKHKKERAKVVNMETRESYYFDKDWCKR